jgi:hypothetical protein
MFTHCILFYRTDEEKELIHTAYKSILRLIPKLKKLLPIQADVDSEYLYRVLNAVRRAHTPHDVLTYVIQMQGGCNTARSETIRRIKLNIIVYLGAGQNPIKINSQDKSWCGLNNPVIGRLLIPAKYVTSWDADTDACVNRFLQLSANMTFPARGMRSTLGPSKYRGRICPFSYTTTIHTNPTTLRRAFSRDRS